MDLLYQCLGCRSIKTLLLANQANLWANASIIVRNDLILTSDHDIVTIHKQNHIKSATSNPLLKPGQILCLDIVKNTAKCAGLTQNTMFAF